MVLETGEPMSADPSEIRSVGNGTSRDIPHILTVIGQPILAETVRLALDHGRFAVRLADTANRAETVVAEWMPHLVIVDIDLAEGAILEQLTFLLRPDRQIPVLALTRRDDLRTKLAAFDWGVDDILTLPFAPSEFVARVLVLLRRHYPGSIVFKAVIPVHDLEIDILNRTVKLRGVKLHLTSLEERLLYLLVANAGRTLTQQDISDFIWGTDGIGARSVVDQTISNLRRKLMDDWHHPRYIASIKGKGYTFLKRSPEEPRSPESPDPSN